MTLSDDIKAKIQAEYDSCRDKLWAGKTKEERSKLGVPPCNIVQGDALDPKSYEAV